MNFQSLSRFLRRVIDPQRVEASRNPDLILDDGGFGAIYLKRWHLLPRNRFFNVYLHKFCSSDPVGDFHDHPYANMSILLKGFYFEEMRNEVTGKVSIKYRQEGDLVFRRGVNQHRIDICHGEPCWTLFVTGPRLRDWGFIEPENGGWITHEVYNKR